MGSISVMIVAALTLVACSGNKEEPAGVIPHAQKQAVERARGVEDTLKKQEQELRKKVNEAS